MPPKWYISAMVTAGENWASIREFPDYEVSNLGRVRRATAARGTCAGRIRTPVLNQKGYATFVFDRRNYPKLRMGHRLVADAFLGPIPEDMQVNHKNGVKSDNRVDNLEIVTNGENRTHAYRTLGVPSNRPRWDKWVNRTLEWDDVTAIRTSAEPASDLAERYGISRMSVWRIRTGKSWRDEDRPST